MSKELERYARTALSKQDEQISTEVGRSLVGVGLGGLAVWGVAGLVPFLTYPVLLVVLVVLGGYLWARN